MSMENIDIELLDNLVEKISTEFNNIAFLVIKIQLAEIKKDLIKIQQHKKEFREATKRLIVEIKKMRKV